MKEEKIVLVSASGEGGRTFAKVVEIRTLDEGNVDAIAAIESSRRNA
jgi:hypothetical protein